MTTTIQSAPFGTLPDGRTVMRHELRSTSSGVTVSVIDYGAAIASLKVPDRDGQLGDIVLGFDSLADYMQPRQPYLGAIVGRVANRIAQGRFHLDGQLYTLACNNGANHLHGGLEGFDKRVWQSEIVTGETGPELALKLVSEDGDQGYPGRLEVEARYALVDSELRLTVQASTDRPTVVNLANHAYFNLAGQGDVLSHRLTLHAGRFLPTDAKQIPTGEWRPVDGTPMDFREPRTIGEGLGTTGDTQLRFAGGYDHNWVLDGDIDTPLRLAAQVDEPLTGRRLQILTTQPGVQFYSGNFLDGSLTGRGGQAYARHAGFCLETQHFPDAPNHRDFPNIRLAPGGRYRHTTIYRFDVIEGGWLEKLLPHELVPHFLTGRSGG